MSTRYRNLNRHLKAIYRNQTTLGALYERVYLQVQGAWAEMRLDFLYLCYLHWGVLDDIEEGGDAFWRLDPWNARAAAQYRDLTRQAV